MPGVSNPGADLHRVVTETFVYGGRGGRLSEKRLRGTDPIASAAASFSQSYSYDLLGNVEEEVYPSCLSPRCERYGPPRTLTYEYRQGALTGIPGWVDSITYHPNGLLSQIRHFNDMTDTWGNDANAMSRPGSISFAGRSTLDLGTYAYDGAGNVQAMGTDRFAYDLVSRLTEADLQTVAKGQSYRYDSFGNLTDITTTEAGVPTARPIGVSPATNRLTGAGYDAAGNVTSLFTLAPLTYDPFNRVTHLTGTGVNRSYLYDTSDNRIAIIDHLEGTEEWHLRGLHDKVVRSFKSTQEGWQWEKDWVYREGQLVGSSHHARWREYHLDHLGSPRLVTGPIGLTVAEYHPFPFGEMASETGPAVEEGESLFRYTGHERDANCETGNCAPEGQDDLDYMLARFYSPVMGRFLGVDPINSGKIETPQSWNRYLYARSNPQKFIDPSGKDVSIAITFVDGISEEEREKIIQAIEQFWRSLNVGRVFVFDAAKFKHGGSLLAWFKSGRASITVDPTAEGRSEKDLVRAGEFLKRTDLTEMQKLQAIANAVNHEVFNHQFHIGPYNSFDVIHFDKKYDVPDLIPSIRQRYGTVQDSYTFADPRYRPAFVNGPVPVFKEDAEEAAKKLSPVTWEPPIPRD